MTTNNAAAPYIQYLPEYEAYAIMMDGKAVKRYLRETDAQDVCAMSRIIKNQMTSKQYQSAGDIVMLASSHLSNSMARLGEYLDKQ